MTRICTDQRRTRRAALALAVLAGIAALPARGQAPATGPSGIYTCVDEKGRKHTSDRPIPDCLTREQRVLNSDGSLRAVKPPPPTAEERAEKEAAERRAALAAAAQADAVRRDRNLIARYPNEAAHKKAREAALDTVRSAIKATELRVAELTVERKPLDNEAEFYKGKPLPVKLRQAIDANDAGLEAQKTSAQNQLVELDRINKLYDAELERLKRLWAGASPGSMGPMSSAPKP